ncbi:MAG: exopolyphosphatase [Gallionella sp.]|nr:exopolyphosphatase [Gallionella sp.]
MEDRKFRLVTRSDFDGLVCAVLFKHLDMVDEIKFVHPKDMQDDKIEVGPWDITTNLPYAASAHMVFDHHASETLRNTGEYDNYINHPDAPSAARVVFEHFGGYKAFPPEWDGMMAAVDKSDSAQLSREEILHPTGWVLLSFLMDSRTGLGRFRDLRISNYDLMMELIDYCQKHDIEKILQLPDVKERIDLYFAHEEKFKAQLESCSTLHNNLVVLDLRNEETIYVGNRFMIYVLFPQANISIHVLWGVKKHNTVFAIGKSILNRTSKTNIGKLMLQFGGGGHENAGTCQIENHQAEEVLGKLIARINADG